MSGLTLDLRECEVRHQKGFCFVVILPDSVALGDRISDPERSELQLFESGHPLGPAHVAHQRIILHGKGLYSHWENALYFSTSDGSDPRSSGRSLSITAPPRPQGEVPSTTTSAALFPRLQALQNPVRKLKHPMSRPSLQS